MKMKNNKKVRFMNGQKKADKGRRKEEEEDSEDSMDNSVDDDSMDDDISLDSSVDFDDKDSDEEVEAANEKKVKGESASSSSDSKLMETWKKLQENYQGENKYVSEILGWHPDSIPSNVEECKSDGEEDDYEEIDETELENADVWQEENNLIQKQIEKEEEEKMAKTVKKEEKPIEEDNRIVIPAVKMKLDNESSADVAKWYEEKSSKLPTKMPVKSASTPVELEKLKERYVDRLKDLKRKHKKGTINPAEMRMFNKLNKKMSLMDLRMKKINKKNVKDGTYLQRQAELADYKEKRKNKNKAAIDSNQMAVYSKKGNLVFSRFDFSKEVSELMTREQPILPKTKLYHKLKKMEEINEVEESGDLQMANKMREADSWQNAFKKAEVGKVKENIEDFKKMIKRKERKKRSSRRKWAERLDAIKKQQEQRQEKRQRNIKKRKDAKLHKKMGRMKKRGHIVPGF